MLTQTPPPPPFYVGPLMQQQLPQQMQLHHQQQSYSVVADCRSSSGASSQPPSPTTSPDSQGLHQQQQGLQLQLPAAGTASACFQQLPQSAVFFSFVAAAPVEQQQQQQQQTPVQYLPHHAAYPLHVPSLNSQAHQHQSVAPQQPQTLQAAGCPVFLPPAAFPGPAFCPPCSPHAVTAGPQLHQQQQQFDLVRWYTEKPPFILDDRTTCLYKMREIDRKPPVGCSRPHLVLSADAEFNTVLAEYCLMRCVFGADFPLQDRVFIKLNRGKDGELAKFLHLFFRNRSDAEQLMSSCQKLGAQMPAWSNPRIYSRHNVYITSLPYFLLTKESLCAFVRHLLGFAPNQGVFDPVKRARVDAERRSAQVELHRCEDASSVIQFFHLRMPEANARPAFDCGNKDPGATNRSDLACINSASIVGLEGSR